MKKYSVRRAIAVGLSLVATMGVAALATPRTALALAAVADDAVGPLLFYRNFDGSNFMARVNDLGGFDPLNAAGPLDRGWTHVVSAGGGRVLFYRASDGLAVTGSVDPTVGGLSNTVTQHLDSGWSHISPAGGLLLFYRASTGQATTARVGTNGLVADLQNLAFDLNWSHITYVGGGRLLFYRSATGATAAGAVDANGGFVDRWFMPQLVRGFHQITYAGGERVLMYQRSGNVLTGRVTDTGIAGERRIAGFDRDLTTVTYTGAGRVLFYRSATGVGAVAEVNSNGLPVELRRTGLDTSLSQITTPLI